MNRFAAPAVLLALLSSLPLAAGAQMLRLDSQQGAVELSRGEQHPLLNAETALQTDDVIKVGSGAGAAFRLGRHGILELGPDSELVIERLPFASYADDLRTVLRIRRGYLRVIWKQPPLDIHWPLFVYLDTDRAALASGEYFFEAGTQVNAICVAEGELALAGGSRSDVATLEPHTCYRLVAGIPPQPRVQTPANWIAVRERRELDGALWATATSKAPPVAVAAGPATAPLPAASGSPDRLLPPPATKPAVAAPPVSKPAAVAPLPAPAPESDKPVVAIRPSPAPKPAATTIGGAWALNLASFPDRAAAEKELQRLKQAGFPGVIQAADVKGRNWYRVQVQNLSSREEAQDMAAQLKRVGFVNAWVMRP